MSLVALSVLFGVIMLGGGFGVMVTASAGFDDEEFEQLLHVGNISASEMDSYTQASDSLRSDSHRRVA